MASTAAYLDCVGGLLERDVNALDLLPIFNPMPNSVYAYEVNKAFERKTLKLACETVFSRFPGSFREINSNICIFRMPSSGAMKCTIIPGTNETLSIERKANGHTVGYEGELMHAMATVAYSNGRGPYIIVLKTLSDLKLFFSLWISAPPAEPPEPNDVVRRTANADIMYIKNTISASVRYTFENVDKRTKTYNVDVNSAARKCLVNIWKAELNAALELYRA